MRKAIAVVLIQIGLFAALSDTADAANSKSVQRTYFNAQGQVIGESLFYCSGDQKHWGQAVQTNRSNAEVSWACADGSVTVRFDIGLPVEIRQIYCAQWPVCSQAGPWPVSEQGSNPLLPGLYTIP